MVRIKYRYVAAKYTNNFKEISKTAGFAKFIEMQLKREYGVKSSCLIRSFKQFDHFESRQIYVFRLAREISEQFKLAIAGERGREYEQVDVLAISGSIRNCRTKLANILKREVPTA